jgi:hypothetical protein
VGGEERQQRRITTGLFMSESFKGMRRSGESFFNKISGAASKAS